MPTPKGAKFSEEHRKNISLGLKNHPKREEINKKISETSKGRKSWCKGLHGIKTSDKGQIAWNKDLKNPYSEDTILAMKVNSMVNIRVCDCLYWYEKGNSVGQVAKILNTNQSVVSRRLAVFGVIRDKGYANRGKKRKPESIKKGAEKLKKTINNPEWKLAHRIGENNPFYGHKHNPETIEVMKKKLSVLLSGENNPNWMGGLSLEPYGYDFKHYIRHRVYERDNYVCQNCGKQLEKGSRKMVAHHKDRNKKNNDLSNLITLCNNCHGITAMHERWGMEVTKTT